VVIPFGTFVLICFYT